MLQDKDKMEWKWTKVDEGVYVKKGKLGYSMIYPIRKDPDKGYNFKNIDWRNFFGLRNIKSLMWIVLFVVLIILSALAYSHDINLCSKVMQDPCEYCLQEQTPYNPMIKIPKGNLTAAQEYGLIPKFINITELFEEWRGGV